MTCKNGECDGNGCLRDGPWGSNAPCHECNGTEALTPDEKREFLNELEADMKAAGVNEPPPATSLVVGCTPFHEWTEFGDFFNKPMSRSILFQEDLPDELYEKKDGDAPWRGLKRVVTSCTFLGTMNIDRDKAIATLREELLKLKNTPDVDVRAFLATPSIIEGVRPCKDGETPDTYYCQDLLGPQPGKRNWIAFCFLHGYRRLSDGTLQYLSPEVLKSIGVTIGVQEGQCGEER